jgi:hypothetical protein
MADIAEQVESLEEFQPIERGLSKDHELNYNPGSAALTKTSPGRGGGTNDSTTGNYEPLGRSTSPDILQRLDQIEYSSLLSAPLEALDGGAVVDDEFIDSLRIPSEFWEAVEHETEFEEIEGHASLSVYVHLSQVAEKRKTENRPESYLALCTLAVKGFQNLHAHPISLRKESWDLPKRCKLQEEKPSISACTSVPLKNTNIMRLSSVKKERKLLATIGGSNSRFSSSYSKTQMRRLN